MNRDFIQVVAATLQERRDLFLGAARRLGTTEQNVEKDFWVCWTLDALFNGLPAGGPRLLFKGGTSLSKAFGLIPRFSEDIDITVFRADLGQAAEVPELEKLSRKKREARLEAIKTACQQYINDQLLTRLRGIADETARAAGINQADLRVSPDDEDPDRQSLLVWYPAATPADGYVRQTIKIESGAKSALDPNTEVLVRPYVAEDVTRLNLAVPHITAVTPERTFWDKVVIIHGQRCWFERRGTLRNLGQRVSRHYYDVYSMAQTEVGHRAIRDVELATDCVRHARMFFGRPDLGLELACRGTFALSPAAEMMETLRRDFMRMSGMIMGAVPAFEDVMAAVTEVETAINRMGA
jgi:hypothetical protein